MIVICPIFVSITEDLLKGDGKVDFVARTLSCVGRDRICTHSECEMNSREPP
jgi:hypothetical protein